MSEHETNKALTEKFIEGAFNRHDLSVFDEVIADDFIEHEELPGYGNDKAGARKWFEDMFRAFPDLHTEVEDMVAEGDRVAVRSTFTGTHEGELLGMAATGKQFSVRAMDIVKLVEGKCTEHWGVFDVAGMMMQLGLAPTPEQAAAGS